MQKCDQFGARWMQFSGRGQMKTFQSNDLLREEINPVLKMAVANNYASLTYSICRWKSFLLGLGRGRMHSLRRDA